MSVIQSLEIIKAHDVCSTRNRRRKESIMTRKARDGKLVGAAYEEK